MPMTQIPCTAQQQREDGLWMASLGSGCQLPRKKCPAEDTPGTLLSSASQVWQSRCKEPLLHCSPGNAGGWAAEQDQALASAPFENPCPIGLMPCRPAPVQRSTPASGKVAANAATAKPLSVSFLLPAAHILFSTTAERTRPEPGGQGPVLALRPAYGDLQPSDHLGYQQPPKVPPHSPSCRPTPRPVFPCGLPTHQASPDQHQQLVPAPGPRSGQGCPGWRGHGCCDTRAVQGCTQDGGGPG